MKKKEQTVFSHIPIHSITNTCHVVTVVETVFVHTARFCFHLRRTGFSTLRLPHDFSGPLPHTASIAWLLNETTNHFT